MNMKTPLLAALLGIPWTVGNAFTLDAVGYSGGTLDPHPYSVFVPCYGEVVFDTGSESMLVLTSAFEEKEGFGGEALRFEPADSIRIIFDDSPSATRNDAPAATSTSALPTLGQIRLLHQASLASPASPGLRGMTPAKTSHAVPETASVVLGVMGCALLLRRRR